MNIFFEVLQTILLIIICLYFIIRTLSRILFDREIKKHYKLLNEIFAFFDFIQEDSQNQQNINESTVDNEPDNSNK